MPFQLDTAIWKENRIKLHLNEYFLGINTDKLL